jgi:hypothetical protein
MPFIVYAIALVIAAGTLALSVNLATAPDHGSSTQRVAASSNVRQIPIDKSSDISRGDPHNKLSPVYPAAPGKDLPPPADVADSTTDNGDMAKPATTGVAQAASTTGSASVQNELDPPRTDTATAPPNSCAVDACGSAYRSFRASDCTYQPFGGPRRICELTDGSRQNANAAPARSLSRDDRDIASRNSVRRLPVPVEDAGYGDRRIVIIERPGVHYIPEMIYEER